MAVQQTLVSMNTPIKDDVLTLCQAKYSEQLGLPFTLEIELFSTDEDLLLDELLGQTMTINFEVDHSTRYFNGIVTAIEQKENQPQNETYLVTLRPWLWLLSLSQKCRIFQQQTFPDIIKSVFDEMGFSDYEDRLSNKYGKQEYIVQFNESDFDFVTRIMEQEGIFYSVKHSKDKHSIVLHDDNASLNDIGKVPYVDADDKYARAVQEGIYEWESKQQVRSGGFTLSSFDFELPTKNLRATSRDPKTKSLSSLQKYTYEGRYSQRKDGEQYTKLLMERENACYTQAQLSGRQRNVSCGSKFTLTEHAKEHQNKQHVVTYYECILRADIAVSEEHQGNYSVYEFSAQAIPAEVTFRPEQTIPKPTMQGPQTATVVGKKKEEIWTDKYGRIKVQFHWDESSKGDESSSCWIRVAQSMAGKNWGSIYIPRVGQEVLVDFIQGDPNQPIVIGCVFNGASMPPYALPSNATLTGFRSHSTENAGTFNEIRFEDKKGDEQLFIHASKNKDISVSKDCFETIGADRHLTIKQDQHIKVNNNRYENISGDNTQKVGKDFNLSIDGKEAKEVGKSISLNVAGNGSENYEGGLSVSVDKDAYIKSNNICIEANNNITLQVGSSFIAIERGGITISSPGKLVLDTQSQLSIDAGANIDISANGAASIKGASVKIN